MAIAVADKKELSVSGNIIVRTLNDVDLASVAAATTAEQDLAVPGLAADEIVLSVTKPGAKAGIGIVNARVKEANKLAVTMVNATAAAVDDDEEDGWILTTLKL